MRSASEHLSLLVFSDDWGRHPSSAQHLVSAMMPEVDVTWVNTIGTRRPRLDWLTTKRVAEKLLDWSRDTMDRSRESSEKHPITNRPSVIQAKMWPWMKRRHDRLFNQFLLTRQLQSVAQNAHVVTTIPIVADIVDQLPARRWIYYCVDDFSLWPGLDGRTMKAMEDALLPKMDAVIAAGDKLADGIRQRGFDCEVLTHGVDLDFWNQPAEPSTSKILFWGVVDRRMNADWLLQLADRLTNQNIELVGPIQDPDPRLLGHPRIQVMGPVAFESLPALAASADVLMMPYADIPVTRAMQPLKLKEYLATGRPVVCSKLPSTIPWSDCADVVDNGDAFCDFVFEKLQLPDAFESARHQKVCDRLADQSWLEKSNRFSQLIFAASSDSRLDRHAG